MITFQTSCIWKLYHICEFLNKLSQSIDWIFNEKTLYGFLFDDAQKLIAKTCFEFDSVSQNYPPVAFDLNTAVLLEKISGTAKIGTTTSFSLENNILLIKKEQGNKISQHKVFISVNEIVPEMIDIVHVETPFLIDTSVFATTCYKISKNTNVIMLKRTVADPKAISFHNSTDIETIYNGKDIKCTENVELQLRTKIFSMWKKSLANIATTMQLSFNNNNIIMTIGDDTCASIKIGYKL